MAAVRSSALIVYSSGTTGCRNRSCTAMAASSSSCWRCSACTTISAAPITRTRSASAITGTRRPAGSCGIRRSAACSAAPPAASSTVCPGGTKDKPDWTTLWRFVARAKATFFGAGAAFFASCAKAEIDLSAAGDLSRLRCLGSTGSPLSADTQAWFQRPLRGACRRSTAARRRPTSVGQHLRRHRFRRRLHRRQSRTAADARRDAVPLARSRGGSLQ